MPIYNDCGQAFDSDCGDTAKSPRVTGDCLSPHCVCIRYLEGRGKCPDCIHTLDLGLFVYILILHTVLEVMHLNITFWQVLFRFGKLEAANNVCHLDMYLLATIDIFSTLCLHQI